MTTLGQDTFVRADQSGWGTASDGQSWANVGGPATYDITSNHGRIGNFNNYTVNRLGSNQTADIDAVVTLQTTGSTLNGAGHAWRVADIGNNYRTVTFDNAIYIDKWVGGTRTNITSFAKSFTTSTHLKVRVQHIGSTLKVKAWVEGSSEPDTWDATLTESSITAAGYFGLVSDLFGGAGTGVSEYWDYSVTDGQTTTTSTRTVTSTAAILTELTRTVPASAALLTELTRTVPATAAIQTTEQRSVPATAAILTELTRSVPSSAAILVESSRNVPSSAAILTELARSVPASAAINVTERIVPASAAILTELTRTVTATASIAVETGVIETNATAYVRGGSATTYTRSGDAVAYVRKL